MADLLEQLYAALDQEERIARSTFLSSGDDGDWRVTTNPYDGGVNGVLGRCIHLALIRGNGDLDVPEQAVHIATQSPKRTIVRLASQRKLLALHAEVHRDIGWLEDGDERMEELPVCGHCVPKHSWFKTRAEVPAYPCATVLIVAEGRNIQP